MPTEVNELKSLGDIPKGLAFVEVYRPGCVPCVQLEPVLGELAKKYADKISFHKVNYTTEEVMRRLGSLPSAHPTIVLLNDGKVVEHFTGAKYAGGVGSKRTAADSGFLEKKINRFLEKYDMQKPTPTTSSESLEKRASSINLSENSLITLHERYLKKDEKEKVIETPEDLFNRVAQNVAKADAKYSKSPAEIERAQQEFYEVMANLQFLPNSPTLMNAGRDLQQLSACFVLPIDDSIESIFRIAMEGALVHKSGGGTGYSFSRIRPENSRVKTTSGVASGPISFMYAFNVYTDVVKQGGTRRGANMGILRVDHPNIQKFIHAKGELDEKNSLIVKKYMEEAHFNEDDFEIIALKRKLLEKHQLNNFNISVGITKPFMDAVEGDLEFTFIDPSTKKEAGKIKARNLLEEIVDQAWKTGDPGLIFLDRMNEYNPTPLVGEIEATNPCGEQPLLPYESCNLGSINLAAFARDGKIDYNSLGRVVDTAVHFLDNVIDMNKYPMPQIEEITKANRKIGLGVMGFADMLFMLKVQYGSEESLKIAEEVMKFIRDGARKASIKLAEERGVFPNWKGSIYDPSSPCFKGEKLKLRNATLTTIAPTGTISLIADCESGIEPPFDLAYTKTVMDGKVLHCGPRGLEYILRKEGFDVEGILSALKEGKRDKLDKLPEEIKKLALPSTDLTPEQHIRVQAAFQKYVDNAVSKTINLPNSATREDIKQAYLLAYRLGCKGLTVYRDGSKDVQVLETKVKNYPIGKPLPKERLAIVRSEIVGDGKKIFVITGYFEDEHTQALINRLRKDSKPTEFFTVANFFDPDAQIHISALSIRCSKDLRKGIPVEEIAGDLANLGSAAEQGYDEIDGIKYVNRSIEEAISRALLGWRPPKTGAEVKKIEIPEEIGKKAEKNSEPPKKEEKPRYGYCQNCGKYGVVRKEGCDKCMFCGNSIKGCE